MRAKNITKEQTEQVINMFGNYTCVEISKMLGLTVHQVYEVRKRYNLTNKTNPEFQLNDIQKQIFISGKLGDGNFKKNGVKNYYYRESHAEDEVQYLQWKADVLGNEILTDSGLHKISGRGFNVQQMYEITTKTSPTLIQFAEMSNFDAIHNLNIYGLIMFILDDGWFSKHSKKGNFCISGEELTVDELSEFCKKATELGLTDVHITGQKRKDIWIPSDNNILLYETAISIIPKEIDIIMKKFSSIKEF